MSTATQPETIAIAMSGGVDSSAVAALLRAEGHTLVGLTLQLWNQRRLAGHEGMPETVQGRCCSIDDVYDARRVAEHLGIPYYLVNQEERFEAEVVRPLCGRVPGRAHARSLYAVQQPSEVRSLLIRLRGRSARTASPPGTMRATGTMRSAGGGSWRGRGQIERPDVFSVWPDAGAALAHALPAGRDAEARRCGGWRRMPALR